MTSVYLGMVSLAYEYQRLSITFRGICFNNSEVCKLLQACRFCGNLFNVNDIPDLPGLNSSGKFRLFRNTYMHIFETEGRFVFKFKRALALLCRTCICCCDVHNLFIMSVFFFSCESSSHLDVICAQFSAEEMNC